MIIPVNLSTSDPTVIQGLVDGTLKLTGGVVRSVNDGTIVRHIATVGQSGLESLSPAAGPLLNGVSDLSKMSGLLPNILQMSQIAMGASVLNLGVSAIGFGYMAYKLHQVQNSLNQIQKTLDEGFQLIDCKLNLIADHLAYLRLLAEDNREAQKRLSNDILDLHRTVLMIQMGKFQAALFEKSRFPESGVRTALTAATEARIIFSQQAGQCSPAPEARSLVLTELATQGWAVASSAESYLLMEIGRTDEALDIMQNNLPQFRTHVIRWTDTLVKEENPNLSTSYKFGVSPLRPHIAPARCQRIQAFSTVDQNLPEAHAMMRKSKAEAELMVSTNKHLMANDAWTHKQVAIAEYLDGLAELTYRLESLQAFAKLCHKNGIKNPADILPKEEGVYFIDPT